MEASTLVNAAEERQKASTLVACAIYDTKVGVYFQPFFARSRAEAMRSFSDAANQEGHVFNNHPGDFTLFVLAEWDEETGHFEALSAYDNLGTALEHQRQRDQLPGQQALA